MSKIKLTGDSSGYVEISAPSAAGNNTLELPSSGSKIVVADASDNVNVAGILTSVGGLNVGTGGTIITTTAGGLVGIGTDIPTTEFEVLGGSTVATFKGTGGNCFIGMQDVDDGTLGFIGVDSGHIKLQTSGSSYADKLIVDPSGRVTMPYQPYFYARPTTAGDGQTANPYTFANVIHNVGGHFKTDAGTGQYQIFTAPIDGIYSFQTCPGYKQTGIDWNVSFRINGIAYAEVARFIGSPSSHSLCTGSITLKLSAGDYVDVTNLGNAYHINPGYNFFCGYLVG